MKRKLPKAIRVDPASSRRARPANVVSEPLPEPRTAKKTKNTVAELIQTPQDERRAASRKIVERFSLWSGAAGLLPVPFVDLAVVGIVQIQMLRRISQVYDVPFSKNRGKAIIASFAGTMIPASASLGAASTLKSVPIAGTAVGAVTTPALAMGATYVIGMAFIQHFASGGTLLDFEPPNYREFLKK
jgi:uncharacterized protein (DUF697 family)